MGVDRKIQVVFDSVDQSVFDVQQKEMEGDALKNEKMHPLALSQEKLVRISFCTRISNSSKRFLTE